MTYYIYTHYIHICIYIYNEEIPRGSENVYICRVSSKKNMINEGNHTVLTVMLFLNLSSTWHLLVDLSAMSF